MLVSQSVVSIIKDLVGGNHWQPVSREFPSANSIVLIFSLGQLEQALLRDGSFPTTTRPQGGCPSGAPLACAAWRGIAGWEWLVVFGGMLSGLKHTNKIVIWGMFLDLDTERGILNRPLRVYQAHDFLLMLYNLDIP